MPTREQSLRGRRFEYKWIVLLNTTLGVLMAALDTSILTIALPEITHSLAASVVEMMWVVMGFQLVVTSLQLPISRLADMHGRVRPYILGFAMFTLASALCGLAQTGAQLLVFRLIQGAGAAFLYANSIALVTDAFPASQRGFALSVNQMAGVSGVILGTILGGVITQFLGWRYIFFINVPIGIFATVWALAKLHEIVEPERAARLDIGGMLTFPLSIACVLGGLTLVVLGQAGDPVTIGLFAAALVFMLVFLYIERHVDQPMMDLSLLRIRIFWAGNTSLLLNSLARGSTLFIMSWYFQVILNDSPVVAGLKLLPMVGTMLLVGPIAGLISDRFGSRLLSTIGLACTLVAQLWMVTFPVDVAYGFLALALCMLGIGNGLFNSPNTRAVMNSVPPNRRGVAAGMRTLLMNTGQTAAIGIAMVFLSTVMSCQLLTALLTGGATAGQAVDSAAFMQGFHEIYAFGALISVIAIVCSSLRGSADTIAAPSEQPARLRPTPIAEPRVAYGVARVEDQPGSGTAVRA
jgi:EmrB/QacA subfamily drug resistance transporter